MADDRQHRIHPHATNQRCAAGAGGRAVLTPLRLDLGSGGHPRHGFEGVDRVDLGQRWIVDLDQRPWPWDDGTVGEVWCSHLVEHVADLVAFMDELWRVMSSGGRATIRHPYAWSDWAIADPTHRRQLTHMSWSYFDREWRDVEGLAHYPIDAHFVVSRIDEILAPEWANIVADGDAALRIGVNVINELAVVLERRS